MLSRPFRSWLVPLLLGPTCALALEIGEIQITSSLNQLFDAKIPLPGLTQEELAKVSVKLAPAPMFKEFGLDRSRALGKLVFSVEYNATGEKYVRVVSTEPIREPSLGLLLEFSWPRGKTFREFTVFLDPVQRAAKQTDDRTKTVLDTPPAVAAATPEAVPPPPIPAPVPALAEAQPPKPGEPAVVPPATPATALPPTASVPPLPEAQPPKPEAESPPKPDTVATSATPEATTTAINSGESPPLPIESPLLAEKPAESAGASVPDSLKAGGSYGPVKPGEGLLGIALKVRPDLGITREEMAQALFRANPQAFSKAGINGLKIGSVLRIPTLQEIGGSATSLAARPVAEGAKPGVEPNLIDPMLAIPTRPGASGPDVFPLPAPVVFKPVPVTVTLPALDPKVLKSVPAISAVVPKAGLDPSKPGAATSFDTAALSAHVAPPVLEPVSVTPMLFLAVSEVISSAVQIPAFAIPAQIAPGSLIADTASSKPDQRAPKEAGAKASEPSSGPPSSPPAADASPPAPKPTTPLESRDAADAPVSQAAPAKEAGLAEAASKPATTAPASESDTPESATPLPAKEPTTYKGGEQYGPVAPNERLWDIAVKVRPDPSIGKDVMLKALLMANPQAFAKTDADQMKKGAVLHIPTLQEIVKHTGSPAAKQLLEQQGNVEAPASVAEPQREAGAEQGESASATQTAPAADPVVPPSEGTTADLAAETPPAAAPVTSPAPASTKPAPEPVVYKGGEQYGPVAPNERLWDIAVKVRPDPSIGQEVMMKALFMANPQAFAKTDADQMKKGAVLRIPTLQEIAKHTGSPAAKQLLEQQASGQPKPTEPAQSPTPVPNQ